MIERIIGTARKVWSRAFPLLFGVAVWLAASPVWAKGRPEKEPEPEKGYVLAYFIFILPLMLGLLLVCRPNNRGAAKRKKSGEIDEAEEEAPPAKK